MKKVKIKCWRKLQKNMTKNINSQFSKINREISISFLCLLWAMGLSLIANPIDAVSDGVLQLDSLYKSRCNDWMQIQGLDKLKTFEDIDLEGEMRNCIKARFGDIEYEVVGWEMYDQETNEHNFDEVKTSDPKFEFIGLKAGQTINVDSVEQAYCVKPIPASNMRKFRLLGWNIIIHGDSIVAFNRNLDRRFSNNPKGLVDNVMLSNYNHISTLPYYKEHLIDWEYIGKRRKRIDDDNRKKWTARDTIIERTGIYPKKNPFGIMSTFCEEAYQSSSLPDERYGSRIESADTLRLESIVDNMPIDIGEILEIQYPAQKRVHSFLEVKERNVISKPYVPATLNGVEYKLMLDYDSTANMVFVSKIMTYDPNFELAGDKISGETSIFFGYPENYELREFRLNGNWTSVIANNVILYFYKNNWFRCGLGKYYDDKFLIDEVMLRQCAGDYDKFNANISRQAPKKLMPKTDTLTLDRQLGIYTLRTAKTLEIVHNPMNPKSKRDTFPYEHNFMTGRYHLQGDTIVCVPDVVYSLNICDNQCIKTLGCDTLNLQENPEFRPRHYKLRPDNRFEDISPDYGRFFEDELDLINRNTGYIWTLKDYDFKSLPPALRQKLRRLSAPLTIPPDD